MSSSPQSSSSDGMSRKQRRAAERAARKSGGSSSSSGGKGTGSSGPSMLMISIGAVAIGLVIVVALVLISGGLGDDSNASEEVSVPSVPAPAEELRFGRTLGDPAMAAVSIAAFEDPQCPACGFFTERLEPLIISEFVEKGVASFTYKDFVFLGEESWDGAIAMRVADDMDGKFWDYHQILFHNQDGENRGTFERDKLADMAEAIGLDREEFLERMDDPSYRAAVEAEVAEGRDLLVDSTPSLIINGQLLRGSPQWEDLKAVVEEAAAASTSTEPASEDAEPAAATAESEGA